jgi:hypothetical protein
VGRGTRKNRKEQKNRLNIQELTRIKLEKVALHRYLGQKCYFAGGVILGLKKLFHE